MITLSLGLKILSIVLFLYTPIFVITLLALNYPDNSLLQLLEPDIRGTFQWDFELMFATIYFVWALFLWQASKNPQKHLLFIDFTIWTNIVHGITMIIIGIFKEEFFHLFQDSLVLILPALLLLYTKEKEKRFIKNKINLCES